MIVLAQLETVQVKAIPTKLPDFFEYDAEKLVEIGDHATVADLVIPEGVELITEPEHTIATVYEPSALAAANDAAGGDAEEGEEPEVEGEEGAEGAEGEGGAEGEAKEGAKEGSKPEGEAKSGDSEGSGESKESKEDKKEEKAE